MFEIGFCSLIAFAAIAFIIYLMDSSSVDKLLVYITAGVGYGGLAVGFMIAALKWLFLVL